MRRGLLCVLMWRLCIVLGMLCLVPAAWAQVARAAFEPGYSAWVGAEFSSYDAAFPYQSNQRIDGFGVYADLNWQRGLGAELDAKFLRDGGFAGSTESSYLIGPRYLLRNRTRFTPYAKFLVGIGHINYPYEIGSDSYFSIAPGGGVSYRLRKRWSVRAEYEKQFWLNSPGFSNEPEHRLEPGGVSVGVAYRLF